MKNDKKRQFNCPVTYKENNKKGKGKTLKKKYFRGVRKRGYEYRKTAQNYE